MSEEQIVRVREAIRRAIKASNERECADLPLRDLAEAAIEAMREPRSREYKVCLSCNMTGGRHDPDCPYDGKTHLPKPKQEMDDSW